MRLAHPSIFECHGYSYSRRGRSLFSFMLCVVSKLLLPDMTQNTQIALHLKCYSCRMRRRLIEPHFSLTLTLRTKHIPTPCNDVFVPTYPNIVNDGSGRTPRIIAGALSGGIALIVASTVTYCIWRYRRARSAYVYLIYEAKIKLSQA
jgi:hypothetical protein